MRKDHQPFLMKHFGNRFSRWYGHHYIRPQFDYLGRSPMFIRPRSLEINGSRICAGNYFHLISSPQKPVKFTTWTSKQLRGSIKFGDYCLISPGVEITSADGISIGSNSMIAAECVISDSDWHGIYNRTRPFKCSAAVVLEDNVWLGLRCTVCKGVTIGENSVLGAGSVVTRDIPANVVAAGNPAKVIKEIDPGRRMLKREFLFQKGDYYQENQLELDKLMCSGNSFGGWLRASFKPGKND